MKCRSCSAEIADKAIVCYRCGTPTAVDAPAPPAAAVRARVGWWLLILFVAVGVAVWAAARGCATAPIASIISNDGPAAPRSS